MCLATTRGNTHIQSKYRGHGLQANWSGLVLGWKMVALADNISLALECWDTRTQGEGEIDSSLLLLIIAEYSRAEQEKFGDQILKYMKT